MKTHAVLVSALLLGAAVPLAAPLAGEAAVMEGFSAARLDRIAPAMQAEIAKGTMPGDVALIARNSKIVYLEAHGFLDAAKTKPMPKDAVFRAFSMTKPLTSVPRWPLSSRAS